MHTPGAPENTREATRSIGRVWPLGRTGINDPDSETKLLEEDQ
jgi:hypothetical protein